MENNLQILEMEIMTETRTYKLGDKDLKRIAIQGFEGSFHDIAARNHFGEAIDLEMCGTFDDLFLALDEGKADFGLMAIENSVAGTILPNYRLLREHDYAIYGEVYLRIEHQLMTLKRQTVEQLKEVRSHPMAINQCRALFNAYPYIDRVNTRDTALSAKELAQNKEPNVGVLASKRAAELYGLEIIAPSVEDNKRNFTRFLVLGEKNSIEVDEATINKASICFHLSHRAGTLAAILTVLASYQMNLSKIQSLPLIGKEWEYFIHADIEFDDLNLFEEAMKALAPMVKSFRILGRYARGEKNV